jgi:hypothetical protein
MLPFQENGKGKPRRFSVIRLQFAHRANGLNGLKGQNGRARLCIQNIYLGIRGIFFWGGGNNEVMYSKFGRSISVSR